VVSPFVDRQHGTERVLAELLQRLTSEYRCVIHLYSHNVVDLKVEDPRTQIDKNRAGIYWHRVPTVPGPHLVQFLSWLAINSGCRWWDKHVRGERYDSVISPGINCFDADVVIVHALFQRVWELSRAAAPLHTSTLRDLHRRLYYRLLVRLERLIYGNSRVALAAVSQRTADLLEATFARRDVRVLPNAVDLASFSPEQRHARREVARTEWNFREADSVLLLIGNDWAMKGLTTLLDAMHACQNANMKLLVAGADESRPFRELASNLGLADRVNWVEPRADVMSLYAAADIYVSPTREDAFALPPLEAMACGLPVVTSVCNGGAEVICDSVNGFVLRDPNDSSALAQILKRLSADGELRLRVGAMAALAAQPYTWERNAAKTWEFLNDVARTNKRSPDQHDARG
jgi:glycosyltransferase involved in cell wall biosynthesis